MNIRLMDIKHKLKTNDIFRAVTVRWLVAEIEAQAAEIERLNKCASDLLTSDHQAVDEFNAGFDACKAGLDLVDSESFYRHTHEDLPSHDTFATGYAWAHWQAEQSPALGAGASVSFAESEQ